MRSLLILLTLFALPLVLQAQDKVPLTQKFSLVEIGVATGLAPSVFNPFGNYKLEAFAPNSTILADTNKWPRSTFAYGGYEANLSVWGGFSMKGKANPLLRIGLTFAAGEPWLSSAFSETGYTFDTLQSANSAMVVYADSFFVTRGSFRLFTQHLKIDAALLWHSKNRGRLGLFAGIGGQMGLSLLARTEVAYAQSEYRHLRTIEGPNKVLSSINGKLIDTETEVFVNSTQFACGIYVPLGISMRLGYEGSWLEKTQLFLQVSPRIGALYVAEAGWISRGQMFIQAGLRLGML
jgi:hypothetical protein